MMDWDNITQTGARASGVEEITPRMAVYHRAHRSDTERNFRGGHGAHEGQRQSWRDAEDAGCWLNQRGVSEGAA